MASPSVHPAESLEDAMNMIADRVWESREKSFVETQDMQTLMQTKTIGHLGGGLHCG